MGRTKYDTYGIGREFALSVLRRKYPSFDEAMNIAVLFSVQYPYERSPWLVVLPPEDRGQVRNAIKDIRKRWRRRSNIYTTVNVTRGKSYAQKEV